VNLKKSEILELEITKYAYEGKGIAKIDREDAGNGANKTKFVIFVDGSYPGDKVTAQIIKVKSSYAEARTLEVLIPSTERVKASCKFFGTCGGCKQQDMDYASQLKYKQEQVKDIFERLGGFKEFEFQDIISSEKIFYYRNKMEYTFADRRWLSKEELNSGLEIEKNFALGLHIPQIFDKVLDIDECFLQSPESNRILNFTRDFFKSRSTSVFSTKTHTGYLRNLVIKKSHHTNDLMVNLVTSDENDALMKEYTDCILKEIPEITTVVNNINRKKAQTAAGDYEIVYYGSGYIYDTIGGFNFRISANSFFQTNTLQAEILYNTAKEFADFKGNEVVYDLYSGAGTITIFVSGSVKEVYAIEAVEPAVADAEENSKLNNINNVHFITSDLNKTFLSIINSRSIPHPDVVILDPPRAGMNPVTVTDVISLDPGKIVYVSCNPATQVRDIKLFNEGGYTLVKIRPVDMFPHTYHIENVALLVKKEL
jgi:23S rRNA (uracil1939-C5)-methyltransferase